MRAVIVVVFLAGMAVGELLLQTVPERVSAEELLHGQRTWCVEHSMELAERSLEPAAATLVRKGELDSYLLGRGHHDTSGGMIQKASLPEELQRRLPPHDASRVREERERTQDRADRLGPAPWRDSTFQVVGIFAEGGGFAVVGRDHDLPASPERSLAFYAARVPGDRRAGAEARALDVLRQHEIDRRELLATIWTAILGEARTAAPVDASAYAVVDGHLHVLPVHGDAEFDRAIDEGRRRQESCLREIELLLGIERTEGHR